MALARKKKALQDFLDSNEASVGSVRKLLSSILSKMVVDRGITENSHFYSAINLKNAISFLKLKLPEGEKAPAAKPDVVRKLISYYHFT